MSEAIRWCYTHKSQVVSVRDESSLRVWCALGDDSDDEDECLVGQAQIVFPADQRADNE